MIFPELSPFNLLMISHTSISLSGTVGDTFYIFLLFVRHKFDLFGIHYSNCNLQAKKASTNTAAARLKKSAVIFAGSAVLIIILVTLSQFTAHTPQILDRNGKVLDGSIAELRKVELNGRQEWISIRRRNRKNPVLLFLAGGPGGMQMAAACYVLSGLEERFVVVNWDQPGSGKSYSVVSKNKITVDTYIKDGHALTNFLWNMALWIP